MTITEIEKLNQLVSRTDMSGNEKVKWLTDFIDNHLNNNVEQAKEMEAKLKAKELLDKMSSQTYAYQPYAGGRYSEHEIGGEAGKKCALIMVDDIINILSKNHEIYYWKEVKAELEELLY